MIDKRLLLLGLGAVLAVGCQPSRSVDAKLPSSPQLARVQTPVLHAMPVHGQSDVSTPWRQQNQLSTFPDSFVSQQYAGVVEAQEPQMTQLLPIADFSSEAKTADVQLGSDVGLDNSTQNSQWIQPIQTVEADSLDQSGVISSDDSSSPAYTLELLDVDAFAKSSDAPEPVSDVTVTVDELSNRPAMGGTSGSTAPDTLTPMSVPLPIRQPVKQWVSVSEVSIPAARDIVESEDVGAVAMPASQTFTTPGAMVIPTDENVSENHQSDTGERLAESVSRSRPDSYVVQKGDTLWSVARRFYGSGQHWKDIAQQNHIRRPDRMVVGMTLQLP